MANPSSFQAKVQTRSDLDVDGARGFGLGVGLALTPEFAEKVREGQGVRTSPPVDASSLTFLKGSSVNGAPRNRPVSGVEPPATPATSMAQRSSVSGESVEPCMERSALESVSNQNAAVNGSMGSDGVELAKPATGTREASERNSIEGALQGASAAHAGDSSDATVRPGGDGKGVAAGGGDAGPGAAGGAVVDETPDSWEHLDDGADASSSPVAPARHRRAGHGTGRESAGGVSGAGKYKKGGVRRKKGKKKRVESRPVLLVDLARLCGFRVRAAEEAAAMGSKIRTVLHESFRERSEELFETGSAVHVDTSNLKEELHRRQGASTCKSFWAVVNYPDKIDGVSTEEAWGIVATPSPCPAVETIRRALASTNRHLLWKRDMLEQLEAVAASELKAREAREMTERAEALEAWRASRRERLEKLIEIRPMFERRRAMAAEKVLLAAEKAGELPAEDSVADPVAAAVVRSLDAKLESIDDLIARLEIEEGEDGNGFVPSEEEGGGGSDDEHGYDEECPPEQAGYLVVEGLPGLELDGRIFEQMADDQTAEYSGQARDTSQETYRTGEITDTNADKGAGDDGPAEAAGPTMVTKLRQKKPGARRRGVVQQLRDKKSREGGASGSSKDDIGVARGGTEGQTSSAHGPAGDGVHGDADEGEGKKGTAPVGLGDAKEAPLAVKGENKEEHEAPPKMTLLDAVAAMILGRYPKEPGATDGEHCERVASMHQVMKEAWMQEFGRLPTLPGSSAADA